MRRDVKTDRKFFSTRDIYIFLHGPDKNTEIRNRFNVWYKKINNILPQSVCKSVCLDSWSSMADRVNDSAETFARSAPATFPLPPPQSYFPRTYHLPCI